MWPWVPQGLRGGARGQKGPPGPHRALPNLNPFRRRDAVPFLSHADLAAELTVPDPRKTLLCPQPSPSWDDGSGIRGQLRGETPKLPEPHAGG